ncbi:DUF6882 domain-containing protein [Motilimonas sp. KMU-193]|uniref:DUF6882 domain-containing protein n=1 Tax=Motilimonas sp. KMU-193 TaxID=3388668 RepID=UPI00396B0015
MNDDEFQQYIDYCFDALERKQQSRIDEFGFGSFDRFQHVFEKEKIYLLKDDKVKAKIIPIGSFNTRTYTWMWRWANEAFPSKLRDKSAKLKEIETITGFEVFGNEMADIEPNMA